MKSETVFPGVVRDRWGFWKRWTHQGKRRRDKLKATNRKDAIVEAIGFHPAKKSGEFAELAKRYLEAGCPNRRLERRSEEFCAEEAAKLKAVCEFYDEYALNEITLLTLPKYQQWRQTQCKRGTGQRTVELDWNTLSNCLNYAVQLGLLDFNRIGARRPRLREDQPRRSSTAVRIRKSREVMPANGEQINKIAALLFQDPRSEVLSWQFLWALMSGCRTSELLRMRLDARNDSEPGFIHGDYVYVRRSKAGFNPFLKLTGEFRDSFLEWHAVRYPGIPWFFPGRRNESGIIQSVDKHALGHALKRSCKALGFGHITPHGCRAFYVTMRRRQKATDALIAAEIGDRTVAMISLTYGDLPGGEDLSFLPNEGLPAWQLWRSSESKIKAMPVQMRLL